MDINAIVNNNKTYWNDYADFWFGTTALPQYGVKFPTEDELKLFGDVTGKKMLEICCGSGHSIKYHADRNAGELWGVDSTYVNALAKAGFVIERMIEQNVNDTDDISDKEQKAKMIPISVCFKARKM